MQVDPKAQPVSYPVNGPSQPMQQMAGLGVPNGTMGMMPPTHDVLPPSIADNYQVTSGPAVGFIRV